MYYRIQPTCGRVNNTVLSVNNSNPNGQLIINTIKEGDDAQLWQPIAFFQDGRYRGVALVNKKTGLAAVAPHNDAGVMQCQVTELRGQRVGWNLIGNAIQLSSNTEMNLNVEGEGPYPPGTPVMVLEWDGGAPNETWNFINVDF
jgi:hypothetical protein